MTAPTSTDIEAARLLLGGVVPVRPGRGMVLAEFLVPRTGDNQWRVQDRIDTKNGGKYLFCPCPSWKFSPALPKACKHTDYVIDMGLVER